MQFLIFLFGLVIGSFLNVLIERLPKEESINGRSYCPHCRAILRWYDLIPVLSFILLAGRCRYCGQKFSWQYPIIETATALLFLLIYGFYLPPLYSIFLLFITSCLIVIFVSDLKYYIIPDQIVYSAIGGIFLYRIFEILNFNIWFANWRIGVWDLSVLSEAGGGFGISKLGGFFIAAVAASGFFFFLVAVSRGQWMGWGDVKLAFLMGLILGWPKILTALFLAFFSGALIGFTLVLFNKKTWKSEIPFGTFLSASALIVLFWGKWITEFVGKFFMW